jgi:uncharacterized protein YlzI (FlbEa/FlbD family)
MFIDLTHTKDGGGGRILLNVEHIVQVHERDDAAIVITRGTQYPVKVQETYDDIMKRIEDSRGKVW